MYEHAHFWKYLMYFINGVDLPREIADQFVAISKDTMREHDALPSLARRASRQMSGERADKANEFFKLALDCDCSFIEALGIRRSVMQAR